jgi:hypothetical protein
MDKYIYKIDNNEDNYNCNIDNNEDNYNCNIDNCNIYNNENNYICNICNKSYSDYESLWKHKKMINTISENSNDKTEKKDNYIYCVYCNKIYNPTHVRFNLENVIDYDKIISEHEQECKSIFEDAQECKNTFNKEKTENRIAELEEEIKLLEIELNKCYVSSNKKTRYY